MNFYYIMLLNSQHIKRSIQKLFDQSMTSTENSSCSSTARPSTLANRRNRHIENLKSTMKENSIFKNNILLNEKRLANNIESSPALHNGSVESENGQNNCDYQEGNSAHFELKYELLEKLGEGSNGVVRKCRNKATGELFAFKTFSFQEEHIAHLKENFMMMKRLRHSCIVRYQSLYLDTKKRTAWLVMEYFNFTSLDKAVIRSEQVMKKIMFQLLEALNYIHKLDFVHRDIKLANILFDAGTNSIKIVDFGIAKRSRKGQEIIDMWTVTGTLFYRAPEMFEGNGYRQTVDVWSAGILLYKMVHGKTPFESEYHAETIKKIRSAQLVYPSSFDQYSGQLKKFVSKLLQRKPEERPNAYTCLKDQWFSSLSEQRQVTNNKALEKAFTIEKKLIKKMTKELEQNSNQKKMKKMSSIHSDYYGSNGIYCQ